MIPKIDLADLSADARRFYGRALDSSHRRVEIRDDDDRQDAIALAEFGYGRAYLTDRGGSFTATAYLDAFTVARRAIAPPAPRQRVLHLHRGRGPVPPHR